MPLLQVLIVPVVGVLLWLVNAYIPWFYTDGVNVDYMDGGYITCTTRVIPALTLPSRSF